MYYNAIDPEMGFQAGLKGIVAEMIGGVGNVPGAIVGSLLLGLVESYGIAVFGTSYRNLFAFLVLIVVLVLRPNGLFTSARQRRPSRSPALSSRRAARCGFRAGLCWSLPLCSRSCRCCQCRSMCSRR